MTSLSLNVRNQLARRVSLTALLGSSAHWTTWIFDQRPIGIKVENTQKCMIVVNEFRPFTSPNEHNTMRFPQITIDIWADPTRNSNLSVKTYDADNKIEAIAKEVDAVMHTVDRGTPSGMPIIWGTQAQELAKTGSVIAGSERLDGPDYSDVKDSEGTRMGRLIYGVHLV